MDTETKIVVLKRIAHRFNEAGLIWALGASMLLYFKHITPEFHDIDLMVADDDADRARQILCEMGTLQPPKCAAFTFNWGNVWQMFLMRRGCE